MLSLGVNGDAVTKSVTVRRIAEKLALLLFGFQLPGDLLLRAQKHTFRRSLRFSASKDRRTGHLVRCISVRLEDSAAQNLGCIINDYVTTSVPKVGPQMLVRTPLDHLAQK